MVVASNIPVDQANALKNMSAVDLRNDDVTLLRSTQPILRLSESALQEHDRVSSTVRIEGLLSIAKFGLNESDWGIVDQRAFARKNT